MFKLYNGFGPLSTVSFAFWTNLWLWLFCNSSKLLLSIVVDQCSLDHCYQITVIIIHYKPKRTLAPRTRALKQVEMVPVILDGWIKHHIGPAKQRQLTHEPLPIVSLWPQGPQIHIEVVWDESWLMLAHHALDSFLC